LTKSVNNEPLVSVIVPSYNHANYLVECIYSIINQSYSNFELIVIDDGSTDDSRIVLDNLCKEFGFILVFQTNQGITKTLNRGIREFAKGVYIAFCASDDFWATDKLRLQVMFMERNRFYPMCYGKSFVVDENSALLNDLSHIHLKGGCIFEDIILFKLHPPVNYMFRKEIFDEVGLYDERLVAEDFFMNLKISSKYSIGFIDEFISYYRLTSLDSKIERFEKVMLSHVAAIQLYNYTGLTRKAIRRAYLILFDHYSGYSEYKLKAYKYFALSLFVFYSPRFLRAFLKLIFFWR